jgi:hypothetical protein
MTLYYRTIVRVLLVVGIGIGLGGVDILGRVCIGRRSDVSGRSIVVRWVRVVDGIELLGVNIGEGFDVDCVVVCSVVVLL